MRIAPDESKKLQSICIGDAARLSKRLACHKRYSTKISIRKIASGMTKENARDLWLKKFSKVEWLGQNCWIGWNGKKNETHANLFIIIDVFGQQLKNQKKNHCFIMANRSLFSGIIPWVLRPHQIHNKKKLYHFFCFSLLRSVCAITRGTDISQISPGLVK